MCLRGDALPRISDLAYDLPLDFDPYALPDIDDLPNSTTSSSRPLAELFSSSTTTSPLVPSPVPDDIYNMPDLVEAGAMSEGGHSDPPTSPRFREEGEGVGKGTGLTLEEIGKRRHQEWVESRRGRVVRAGGAGNI